MINESKLWTMMVVELPEEYHLWEMQELHQLSPLRYSKKSSRLILPKIKMKAVRVLMLTMENPTTSKSERIQRTENISSIGKN